MKLLFYSILPLIAASTAPAAPPDHSVARGRAMLEQLPLRFEANQGQWDASVRYRARANGYDLQLTARGASLHFGNSQKIDISLTGGNRTPQVQPDEPMPVRTNYFVGGRQDWHTDVANYSRVRYSGVYPGVDLVYYGNHNQLEYDFVLTPGADPNAIRMKFSGAQRLAVTADGDLVLETPAGKLTQKKPVVYQEGASQERSARKSISARYVMLGGNTVGVQVDGYDHLRKLVIDPTVLFASYIGGQLADTVTAVQLDGKGNLYITGSTPTSDMAAVGDSYQGTNAGLTDIFFAVVDANTDQLKYLTYLGGTSLDIALAMAVDSKGVAYLTGTTTSTNFPVVGNAVLTTGAATTIDAFIAAIDPTQGAGALIYSTYLGGGTGNDSGNAITVDAQGNIYVVGTTKSTDFPVTGSAYASVIYGTQDAFLTEVNPNNAALIYSTYIGGEDFDDGRGVALAPDGQVYMVVTTNGLLFPLAGNSYSSSNLGFYDIAICLFNTTKSNASSLTYSTYFGGSGVDVVRGVAIDPKGNLLITGYTLSADYPTTATAAQRNYGGGGDAFVTAVNAEKAPFVVYSTFLGGSDGEVGYAVASDSAGIYYVTGYTLSSDFPTTSNAPQPAWGFGIDVFLTRLDPSVTGRNALQYSTYFGGENINSSQALVVDKNGTAYVGGYVEAQLILTDNAFQGAYGGGFSDGFVLAVVK